MNPTGAPEAELRITTDMVRALIASQFPELASQRIEYFASGWDNEMFSLGDAFLVRMPRRVMGAESIANEQKWLPLLAKQLPVPTPVPVRVGIPEATYPWRWSVLPWLSGVAADCAELKLNQAKILAKFLRALHVASPVDAPRNPYRGTPLTKRAEAMQERLERLAITSDLISQKILATWRDALAAPIDVANTWLHGDLHAQNVLVDAGRISAVIDWGDVCQGDCATDLASLWMLLPDASARAVAMQAYGATEATWQRARGWAIVFGSILLETGRVNNPRHAAMGERTLRSLNDE